jgi:uncharacterized protein (TIGR02996 family)
MIAPEDRCPHTKKEQSRKRCSTCILEAEDVRLQAEHALARPLAREPQLEAAMRLATTREELEQAREVYADWLEQQNSPLAQLIRLQTRRAPTDEIAAILTEHPELLGRTERGHVYSLSPVIDRRSVNNVGVRSAAWESLFVRAMVQKASHVQKQVLRRDDVTFAIASGFVTDLQFRASHDQLATLLASPMFAFVTSIATPYTQRLFEILASSLCGPTLEELIYTDGTHQPTDVTFDRARLPKLNIE